MLLYWCATKSFATLLILQPNHLLLYWFCNQIICYFIDSATKSYATLLILQPNHMLLYWFCNQILCYFFILQPNHMLLYWFCNQIICYFIDSATKSYATLLIRQPNHSLIYWFWNQIVWDFVHSNLWNLSLVKGTGMCSIHMVVRSLPHMGFSVVMVVITWFVDTVGCRYNAVQYNIILQWLRPNINQSFNTQMTPHISP